MKCITTLFLTTLMMVMHVSVHADVNDDVQNFMSRVFGKSPYVEQQEKFEAQRQAGFERQQKEWEKTNQKTILYNNVLDVIDQIHQIVGDDFKYYHYYTSAAAQAYKFVHDNIKADREAVHEGCRQMGDRAGVKFEIEESNPNFMKIFLSAADFQEKYTRVLESAKKSLDILRAHAAEEKNSLRTFVLYNQMLSLVSSIDGAVGLGYSAVNKEYNRIRADLVQHTFDQCTKEALEKDLPVLQNIAQLVKEHQTEEEQKIDLFKRKITLLNQAIAMTQEIYALNKIVSHEYNRAVEALQKMIDHDVNDTSEKEIQDVLTIIQQTRDALRA